MYTSKKTTTVFSASTCYVTATTVTACTRRKKKSIIADLYDEDADISFDTVTRYWLGYIIFILLGAIHLSRDQELPWNYPNIYYSLREADDDFAEKDPSLDASLEQLDSSIEDADKSFRDKKVDK